MLPREINILKYENENHKFIYDLDSGFFCEGDDLLFDTLDLIPEKKEAEIVDTLKVKYSEESVRDILKTLNELYESKEIFCKTEQKSKIKDNKFVNLWLNLSHDCNLRCKYCFGHGGSYGGPRELMSEETAKKCIDIWFQNLDMDKKKYNVTLFGGEPLMNKKVLKYSVNYVKQLLKDKDKEVLFSVTTNGTAFDDDIIDFFVMNKIKPMISIDGTKVIQDNNRPTASGNGSYDMIINNLNKLKQHFNIMDARITLTHENAGQFAKCVKHLWDIGFNNVSYEVVTIEDDTLSLTEEDIICVNQQIQELTDLTYENLINHKHKFFSNVIKIGFHVDRRLLSNDCSYQSTTTIMFTPEGKMYKCHRMMEDSETQIGDLENGVNWDKYKKLKSKNIEERVCKDCWAKIICGGGCPQENLIYNKDVNVPYKIKCISNKFIIKEGLRLYTKLYIQHPDILEEFFRNSNKHHSY